MKGIKMSWLHAEDCNKNSYYSAFASDIEAYKNKSGEGPHCPVCKEVLKMSFIFKYPVAVGEETHAKFENTHNCGAKIVVFND
jgi:hypothetical protein